MTTYTDEVNIYNPEAVGEGIESASQTATKYITSVTNDGIVVAEAGKGASSSGAITSSTTGWHLGGALEYVRSGVARFWIGLKDAAHDLTPTVIIGKRYVSGASDNESHMELDYHSLQMIDKEGNAYLHVSDLRGTDGSTTINQKWTGDGTTTMFDLNHVASSNTYTVSITGQGEITSGITKTVNYVSFNSAPAVNADIRATYTVTNVLAKAYTIGIRNPNDTNPGSMSFSEGYYNSASGMHAHAEGTLSDAKGYASHAEGYNSDAFESYSHAEGNNTTASGPASHSEGSYTTASGIYSHAEGSGTEASGINAHAQNLGTVAASYNQTAVGKWNVEDANGVYALIIGNGTADNARSNALAVQWDGTVETATPIPIASGGTGATSASAAWTALGGGSIGKKDSLAASDIPNLAASKITSGDFAAALLTNAAKYVSQTKSYKISSGNGTETVEISMSVPSGYAIKGITKITAGVNAACIYGWSWNGSTVTVWVRNLNSSGWSDSKTMTVGVICTPS